MENDHIDNINHLTQDKPRKEISWLLVCTWRLFAHALVVTKEVDELSGPR